MHGQGFAYLTNFRVDHAQNSDHATVVPTHRGTGKKPTPRSRATGLRAKCFFL